MINESSKFKIFDSDALKNFHKRIFFSIIIFSLCYFIAVFRIANLMIFDIPEKASIVSMADPERGKIFDRNGKLLSTNISSYSLVVNAKEIKNKKEISKKLSSIINFDEKIILQKLNSNKKYVYLKRNISPKEHQKIITLGEINLQTEIEKKRIYPFQNVGAHIVGYVNIDNLGMDGAEKGFENLLSSGKDINLTIDINLQNAVRNELKKTIKKFTAESGTVIIMDINNSEILTLINYPDFDPNNINKSNLNQRINRAFQSNYEMGSTFKPITVAMGIDNNLIKKDMTFDVSKPIKNTIRDWEPCDCSLGIKEIIVKSSNIGAALIAEKIGKENQKKFFNKIGFNNSIKIDLIETAKPYGQPHHWGAIETMTIGYGHGFAVTPLHLALAYSSILNKGKKLNPTINLNNSNNKYTQIVKEETSQYISSLLRAVIQETKITGPKVKIEGYDIGGKTGTAELPNDLGKYDKDSNRTIFVGAFPMSNPKYLVVTIIDKPKRIEKENNSITSATVNAPLIKNIILKMIEILSLPKDHKNEILNAATSIDYNKFNAIN